MNKTHRLQLLLFILLMALFTSASGAQAENAPNKFGAHLLLDNLDERGRAQLAWAKALVGKGGYCKTLFGGITPQRKGAPQHWQDFVAEIYRLDMIPVIRLAGHYRPELGYWLKPEADPDGGYTAMAAAVKSVVSDLPRSDKYPLYIEVWNEPNLDLEWSGQSSLEQYARFFVEVAAAIREIGDSRIKILNGAFALSADATERCIKAHPDFINSFDVWASHPYPANIPPEHNIYDGTAKHPTSCIDGYRTELEVLKKYGRKDIKVLIAETGYGLGNSLYEAEGHPGINETNRADYMMRAFRDHYPRWSELIGVIPFLFSDPFWQAFNWVDPSSKTLRGGLPSKPSYQYTLVRKLAKPTDPTGSISGKVTLAGTNAPVSGAKVRLSGSRQTVTDAEGVYIFEKTAPGRHIVSVTKSGFEGKRAQARVSAGENRVQDFQIRDNRPVTVSGKAIDTSTGKALEGVNVKVISPGDITVTSGADGMFILKDLPRVPHILKSELQGYTSHEITGYIPRVRRDLPVMVAPDPYYGQINLLFNPSFERHTDDRKTGAVQWERLADGKFSVNTGISRTGSHSFRISALPGAASAYRQITNYNTSEAGKTYTASVWVYLHKVSADQGGAWMTLTFCGNGGEVYKEFKAEPVTELPSGIRLKNGRLVGDGGWVHLEATGEAPPEARRISVNLWFGADSGSASFDDAFLGIML